MLSKEVINDNMRDARHTKTWLFRFCLYESYYICIQYAKNSITQLSKDHG